MMNSTSTKKRATFINSKVKTHVFPACELERKQDKAFVKPLNFDQNTFQTILENEQQLIEYLKSSSVKLIYIDPALGEKALKNWVNTCRYLQQQVFLWIPSYDQKLASKHNPFSWKLKRLMDLIVATVLLLVLAPIILVLALLVLVSSPGPILFCQWRVGSQGQLIRIYKFRTMVAGAEKQHHQVMGNQRGLHKLEDDPRITPLGKWMRKYSLDELPQLFNVLEGKLSLVGPRPWAIYDAIRISREGQVRLNAMPGITGAWQVEARSRLRDIEAVNNYDLKYLKHWSLGWDLQILLKTIPRVISGFGAH